MGIEYTNRRGEKYYLFQGTTKTGKPKYYVSRKPDGTPVEKMPDGFELHEEPQRGVVSIRKVRTSRVTLEERRYLEEQIRALADIEYFRMDAESDSVVIYTPNVDPRASAALIRSIFGDLPGSMASECNEIGNNASYHPMLRFTLRDEEKRHFSVERWCFRGSVDGWIPVGGSNTLENQVKKYLPHLNEESFFDLM